MPTKSYTALGTFYLNIPGIPGGSSGTYVVRAIRANGGAADYWLQLHNSVPSVTGTLPADTAVPVTTPLLVPMNYTAEYQLPSGIVIPSLGLVAMMSSTRDTLTRVSGAVTDISVDVDEFSPVFNYAAGASIGDYTTSLKQLQVWAESAGPKKLMELHVTNTSTAFYAQLFATDSPAEGAVPIYSWLVESNTSKVISFGMNAGTTPYRQDADGTAHQGCTIILSSTQNTKTLIAGNTGKLKAFYQ